MLEVERSVAFRALFIVLLFNGTHFWRWFVTGLVSGFVLSTNWVHPIQLSFPHDQGGFFVFYFGRRRMHRGLPFSDPGART